MNKKALIMSALLSAVASAQEINETSLPPQEDSFPIIENGSEPQQETKPEPPPSGDPRDALPDCDKMEPKAGEFCKCYGSALKGQNDCTNKAGTHSCGGFSKEDCEDGEYKVVEAPKCGAERKECQDNKGKILGFWAGLKRDVLGL